MNKRQILENKLRKMIREELSDSGITNSIQAKLQRIKLEKTLESLMEDVASEINSDPGPREYTDVGDSLIKLLGKMVTRIVNSAFQEREPSKTIENPGTNPSGMSFRDR